jgi:transcriptional regulator with XRE-family HTH domain
MTIPEHIKAKRKARQETQAQFAKRFKVNQQAVSLWETGKREAPYKVLQETLPELNGK